MISLLNGTLKLCQSDLGLKSTSDAVFLAAACPVNPTETVLDLGCGIGTAILCLKHRVPECVAYGVDMQADHIDIAAYNAKHNNLDIDFQCMDIFQMRDRLYHHIICNPPYFDGKTSMQSPKEQTAIAKHLSDENTISEWVKTAHRLLRAKGTLTIIYRTDYINDLIYGMHGKFGAITIVPLWPKDGKSAKHVIVRAIKDSKTPSKLTSGLILHNQDGSFTASAELILRDGSAMSV